MPSFHVAMRFDFADETLDAVEAKIRGGLEKVAPDMAVQFKRGRKRHVAEVPMRFLTLTMTIDAVSEPEAERRAMYWLRRGIPTVRRHYPEHVTVKELSY